MFTKLIRKITFGLLALMLTVTACQHSPETPIANDNKTKRPTGGVGGDVDCKEEDYYPLPNQPALGLLLNGSFKFSTGAYLGDPDNHEDCDYVVAFPDMTAQNLRYTGLKGLAHGYPNSVGVVNAINNLISDAPGLVPCTGGFGNSVGQAFYGYATTGEVYMVFGKCRTDQYLGNIARIKKVTVEELLRRHVVAALGTL